MSNDTAIEDGMHGSCKGGTLFPTELGDAAHCPGCLCQSKRLYCDDCMKNKRKIAKTRQQKTILGAVYTVVVAIASAGVYHLLNESCRTSKQESLIVQWLNAISKFYA